LIILVLYIYHRRSTSQHALATAPSHDGTKKELLSALALSDPTNNYLKNYLLLIVGSFAASSATYVSFFPDNQHFQWCSLCLQFFAEEGQSNTILVRPKIREVPYFG
jgi:hypothetical protein